MPKEQLSCGKLPIVCAEVYINRNLLILPVSLEADQATFCLHKGQASISQGGGLLPKCAQKPEMLQKLFVLFSPGVGAAVKGIFAALHACLVTVI